MHNKILSIKNVKKIYNSKVVLDIKNINFDFNKTYAIIGSNGSGKSTFSKIITNIIPNDDNLNINIIDKNIKKNNKNNFENNISIGYMAQKTYVFNMSLEKNLLINTSKIFNFYFLYKIINRKNELITKMQKLINDFKLQHLSNKNAKKFSGGEQQKVGLARLMMKDYNIIILDEPTSAMDYKSTLNAEKIIKKYVKNKLLILITHDLEQAKRIADEIYIFSNGKCIKQVKKTNGKFKL